MIEGSSGSPGAGAVGTLARRMDPARLFDELVRAAERVGVTVRVEPFDPTLTEWRRYGGGLCTVHGRRVILVDASTPLADRIATVAASLAEIDLEAVFVPPLVRATIAARARAAPPPKPKAPRGVVVPIDRARRRKH